MNKKQDAIEETIVENNEEVIVEGDNTEEVVENEVETTEETVETTEEVVENEVETTEEVVETTEEVEFQTGIVTAAKLNVRELPNKTSDVVCVISKDDVVTIVTDTPQTYEDFYEVCTADGKYGFCMKQFINLN